jgi:signal transduction histidine kinase
MAFCTEWRRPGLHSACRGRALGTLLAKGGRDSGMQLTLLGPDERWHIACFAERSPQSRLVLAPAPSMPMIPTTSYAPSSPPAAEAGRWVDRLPTPAYTCDSLGAITSFNRRIVELWGAEPAPGEADQYWRGPVRMQQLDGSEPCGRPEWLACCLRENRDSAGETLVLIRRDGSRATVQAHASPLRDGEGRPTGALCVLVDITERTRMEVLLREQARLLEMIARGRTLRECLEALAEAAGRQHPGMGAGVLVVEESQHRHELAVAAGFPPEFTEALKAAPAGDPAVDPASPATSASRLDAEADTAWRVAWRDLCAEHGIAAVHWTPVRLVDGTATAAFFLCFGQVRRADAWERQLADACARIASIAIQRDRSARALRASRARLREELTDSHLLHRISLEMTMQDEADALYAKIVDAAMQIMQAPYGSMQVLDPVHGENGELRQIAARGLPADAPLRWQSVGADAAGACALAWRRGERVIVSDVLAEPAALGKAEREAYSGAGIRAVQCTPLRSRNGRLLGMISTYWRNPYAPGEHDLRLLDILARQAADLIERTQAEEALREADRSKDEFLGQLAHELRNPLAPIRNAMHLLRQRGNDVPEVRWSREVIERQVAHLTRLIDDLLDVSRLTRNRLELRLQRVDLHAILRAAMEASRPLIDQKSHRLVLALPEDPLWLDADLVRLAQVFTNLLSNAAKYTEPGGEIVLAAAPAPKDPKQIVVAVRDSGVGLSAEKQSRVFDLFYQVDRTMERSQGGLGIGLSLVRRLVDLHGGTVQVRSEGVGRGCEFVVRLPLAPAPAPQPQPQPREEVLEEVVDRKRRRILVVDDNAEISDSLAVLLRALGHEVRTAGDGEEAIAVAERMQPDAVLLDLNMPRLDGYAACRRIRASVWGRNLLLVAVTAWGQHEARRRGIEAGFDFHLTKPADPQAIASLIGALGE